MIWNSNNVYGYQQLINYDHNSSKNGTYFDFENIKSTSQKANQLLT